MLEGNMTSPYYICLPLDHFFLTELGSSLILISEANCPLFELERHTIFDLFCPYLTASLLPVLLFAA